MATWDAFTLFNETDVLDLHINNSYPHVDHILIVESDRTYAGEKIAAPLWDSVKHKYLDFADKITHIVTTLDGNPNSRWDNEAKQRNDVEIGLVGAEPDDMIFFSCVDEIIHPALFGAVTENSVLELDNYYYALNGKDVGTNPIHPMPICIRRGDINGNLHQIWEGRHSLAVVPGAGWHFSYLGGIDQIVQKLEAYSHSEHDTDEVKDNLKANIAAGNDIFGRPDHAFKYVKIDKSFPPYLYENQDKFKELIHAS